MTLCINESQLLLQLELSQARTCTSCCSLQGLASRFVLNGRIE